MSEVEQGEEHEYGLLVPVGHVRCPDAVEPDQAATQTEPVYILTRGEVGGILDSFIPSDCAGMDPDEFDRLCERVARALNGRASSIIEGAISEHLTLMRA